MSKNFDHHIKRVLDESSEYRTQDTEDIWNAIDQELFSVEPVSRKNRKNKGASNLKKAGLFITAAAAVLLVFSTQTETGSALVNKVKTMFEPEKEITQQLEGHDEKANLKLNEGKEAKYVIYVDEDRYVMKHTATGDVITTKEPLEDRYPEVSMTITQHKDKQPQDLYEELKASIISEYSNVLVDGKVDVPIDSFMLEAKKPGNEWNTELTKLYVFSNGADGSFVIQEKLFSEATEGHGVRFDEMIKQFQIVPEE